MALISHSLLVVIRFQICIFDILNTAQDGESIETKVL